MVHTRVFKVQKWFSLGYSWVVHTEHNDGYVSFIPCPTRKEAREYAREIRNANRS